MTESRTITRRVAEYPCDSAARQLARLAWPGEADDHQERWVLRIVFEPEIRDATYQSALARCSNDEARGVVNELLRRITA